MCWLFVTEPLVITVVCCTKNNNYYHWCCDCYGNCNKQITWSLLSRCGHVLVAQSVLIWSFLWFVVFVRITGKDRVVVVVVVVVVIVVSVVVVVVVVVVCCCCHDHW